MNYTDLCKENNNTVYGLKERCINSILLSDEERKEWLLYHSRSFFHSIVALENIIYESLWSRLEKALASIFHEVVSIEILTGFNYGDLNFKSMFVINAKALMEVETKISGVITYIYHSLAAFEDEVGWVIGENKNTDWQELRSLLRDLASSFSVLCLLCGFNFDSLLNSYDKYFD